MSFNEKRFGELVLRLKDYDKKIVDNAFAGVLLALENEGQNLDDLFNQFDKEA